ncbi:MAG: preprotein translocase subunit YajC [Alphaproteobacteria bacterium]
MPNILRVILAAPIAAPVLLALLAEPAAAQSPVPDGGGIITQLFPLILIFVVFWFLLIRPQMKRAKEHRTMTQNLATGDEVITGGGLHGKVTRINERDDAVYVEISDGVEVKISRSTIVANLRPTEVQSGTEQQNFSQERYKEIRHNLYRKQKGICEGCHKDFSERNFHVDHIKPQSAGGKNTEGNLQLLCGACNSVKGNRTMSYLRKRLKEEGIL